MGVESLTLPIWYVLLSDKNVFTIAKKGLPEAAVLFLHEKKAKEVAEKLEGSQVRRLSTDQSCKAFLSRIKKRGLQHVCRNFAKITTREVRAEIEEIEYIQTRIGHKN